MQTQLKRTLSDRPQFRQKYEPRTPWSEPMNDSLRQNLIYRGKQQRPHFLLEKRGQPRTTMAEHCIAILNQSIE